ncbi:MAG: 16S rRNA (guanine(527)-N(7))-methyltransferase RsmG [Alphaproteobacteria bacterium]|nr:16S rRNA (guanine(527)-N(7))-methyltransferase RsmG [Alphaproteobacteria bacterium]
MEETDKLEIIEDCIRGWNNTINLVSRGDLPHMRARHIDDSAAAARVIPHGASVIDIGSGAGLPGLVLAALRPDISVTSIESDSRKCIVQQDIIRRASLSNARVMNGRAESLAESESLKAQADCATVRALGKIALCLEYAAPLLKPGGRLILFKSHASVDAELAAARAKGWNFDCKIEKIHKTTLVILENMSYTDS